MGILRRVIDMFTTPSVNPDERDAGYRCLRCGAGFERNYRSCPECGAEFVAPVDAESDGQTED